MNRQTIAPLTPKRTQAIPCPADDVEFELTLFGADRDPMEMVKYARYDPKNWWHIGKKIKGRHTRLFKLITFDCFTNFNELRKKLVELGKIPNGQWLEACAATYPKSDHKFPVAIADCSWVMRTTVYDYARFPFVNCAGCLDFSWRAQNCRRSGENYRWLVMVRPRWQAQLLRIWAGLKFWILQWRSSISEKKKTLKQRRFPIKIVRMTLLGNYSSGDGPRPSRWRILYPLQAMILKWHICVNRRNYPFPTDVYNLRVVGWSFTLGLFLRTRPCHDDTVCALNSMYNYGWAFPMKAQTVQAVQSGAHVMAYFSGGYFFGRKQCWIYSPEGSLDAANNTLQMM